MAKTMNATTVQLLVNWIASTPHLAKLDSFRTAIAAAMTTLSVSTTNTPAYIPNARGNYQVNLRAVMDWVNSLSAPVSASNQQYLQSIREALDDREDLTSTT